MFRDKSDQSYYPRLQHQIKQKGEIHDNKIPTFE